MVTKLVESVDFAINNIKRMHIGIEKGHFPKEINMATAVGTSELYQYQ